mgnify:FL=1
MLLLKIKKFGERIGVRKKSDAANLIPGRNDAIEKWRFFANTAHWKQVYDAWADWMYRGYKPYIEHDEKVGELLESRLLGIEQPILPPAWLLLHANRLIEVECGADVQRVKEAVRLKYCGAPCFVVEQNGRLRGFALSDKLIIAGVSSVSFGLAEVQRKMEKTGMSFLSREDSHCLEKHIGLVNQMMEAAGVPTLATMFRWITKNAADGEFASRVLCRKKCYEPLRDREPVFLLAKL